MLNLNDNQLKEILTQMANMVGVDYKDVDWTKPEYYLDHEWDYETEQDFVDWLSLYMKNRSGLPKELNDTTAAMFCLCHGWKSAPMEMEDN